MNKIFNTYIPEGFSTVSVYLMSENPKELIEFLTSAFYMEVRHTTKDDNGQIVNAIVRIGKTSFMIGWARGEFEGMRSSFYLYVNNVDELHKRSLDCGAKEVFPPTDMDYGDRQSGIVDPSGNYWWISMRLEEKEYD